MIFSLPSPPLHLKQGDVVTFSYQNYSRREAPVNPRILHVRLDVSWERVLREFSTNSRSLPLNGILFIHTHHYSHIITKKKLILINDIYYITLLIAIDIFLSSINRSSIEGDGVYYKAPGILGLRKGQEHKAAFGSLR